MFSEAFFTSASFTPNWFMGIGHFQILNLVFTNFQTGGLTAVLLNFRTTRGTAILPCFITGGIPSRPVVPYLLHIP